jgi:hypothetical protein
MSKTPLSAEEKQMLKTMVLTRWTRARLRSRIRQQEDPACRTVRLPCPTAFYRDMQRQSETLLHRQMFIAEHIKPLWLSFQMDELPALAKQILVEEHKPDWNIQQDVWSGLVTLVNPFHPGMDTSYDERMAADQRMMDLENSTTVSSTLSTLVPNTPP